MTEARQAERDRMWAAVDHLTLVERRALERDEGSIEHVRIPSLWDQATDALRGGLEAGATSCAATSAAERAVVDLTLLEVRHLIRGYTQRSLFARHQIARVGTAAQMRQLAAYVVTHEAADLWWWEYRFGSWAQLLASLLAVNERRPAPLRLRNAPCPECSVRQVVIASDDGPIVVPPLLIDFRDGYVRAAQCSACRAMWWRGAELEALAAALAVRSGCLSAVDSPLFDHLV